MEWVDTNMNYHLDKVSVSQKLALKAASEIHKEEFLQHTNVALSHDQKNPISYFIKGRVFWELLNYDKSLVSFKSAFH